jgi:exosortase/archaeosortase family protein
VTQDVRALRAHFIVAGACWAAVLLAALHNAILERTVVAPFVAWQARLGAYRPGASLAVADLSCAGTDVIALAVAAILAYPVAWTRRLAGFAGAAVWLIALNALRIMTLFAVAGTPAFAPLHLYIWPALLILGASTFVFVWIWSAERAVAGDARSSLVRLALIAPPLVAGYAAALPSMLDSPALRSLANSAAAWTAAVLRLAGADASVGGSTLVVSSTALVITPECILTPMMPVFLACALGVPRRWSRRMLGALLFVPVFGALMVARLLTVALPPLLLATPLYLTHAFHQLVTGAACIVVTAIHARAPDWRVRPATSAAAARAIGAVMLFLVLLAMIARPAQATLDILASQMCRLLPHVGMTSSGYDVQGAFAVMPGFELALLSGLLAASGTMPTARRGMAMISALMFAQLSVLVTAGELDAHAGFTIPVVGVRALSIAIPLVLFMLVCRAARSTPGEPWCGQRRTAV